jgi:site-specific recombinase XerD
MPQLKEVHQEFLGYLKDLGRAEATIIAYSKDIEQLIDYLTGQSKFLPAEARKRDLDGFLDSLREKNYTPKSISRKINAIRTFFKFAKERGYVKEDPSSGLEHPKIESRPPRILSPLEYRALRDTARNDPRTAAIIELLLQTGMRIGELRRLKLENIEFSENGAPGKVRVEASGKTPAREIPLNKSAQDALKRYLKERHKTDEKVVFVTKTGRPLLIRNMRTTINRYYKQAGVENATVNDLRHTFVATHLKRGVPLTTVSKLAGHKRLTTTEKYLEHIENPSEKSPDLEEL